MPNRRKAEDDCRQHQILHPGLERLLALFQIGDHGVERDAQDLKPQEKRHQVAAGNEHRASQRGEQQQHIQLFAVALLLLKVLV